MLYEIKLQGHEVEVEASWCQYRRATLLDPQEGGYFEIESASIIRGLRKRELSDKVLSAHEDDIQEALQENAEDARQTALADRFDAIRERGRDF